MYKGLTLVLVMHYIQHYGGSGLVHETRVDACTCSKYQPKRPGNEAMHKCKARFKMQALVLHHIELINYQNISMITQSLIQRT